MVTKIVRKKLSDHFSTPVRQSQLPKLVKSIIGLTEYSSITNLMRDLEKDGIVNSYNLTTRNNKTLALYSSRPINKLSPYKIAQAMFLKGYFCNLSSIYYHSLTNQVPRSVYICHETISTKKKGKIALKNNELRSAFIKPNRYTNYVFDINNCEIIVVDRERNSDYGVIELRKSSSLMPNHSRVTGIERALIDAVVSPQYNGGIVSVYSYFKNVQNNLNIVRLIEIYKHLNFIYPYSQSIGFFLDRVGMTKQAARIQNEFPPERKFFIDHDAKTTWNYDEKWKIYYPPGLVDEN